MGNRENFEICPWNRTLIGQYLLEIVGCTVCYQNCHYMYFIHHHSKMRENKGDLVVTSIENNWKIHLFKIIEILNKFKIFKYHWIGKFISNISLRRLDFLSEEKISEWMNEWMKVYFRLNSSTDFFLFFFHLWNLQVIYFMNQLCMTYLFTKQERSLIFSSLKKSSFLKSMLLRNFLIGWSSNWKKNKKIKNNNSMIFK